MRKLSDLNKNFAKLDVEKLLGNEIKDIKGGKKPPSCSASCYPGCSPGCSNGGMFQKEL